MRERNGERDRHRERQSGTKSERRRKRGGEIGSCIISSMFV